MATIMKNDKQSNHKTGSKNRKKQCEKIGNFEAKIHQKEQPKIWDQRVCDLPEACA